MWASFAHKFSRLFIPVFAANRQVKSPAKICIGLILSYILGILRAERLS
jgi:hypothetical protein